MSAQEDRRASLGQRIPFEGIVELGSAESAGAGFEAQGIDVSTGGMHLRTAYLPELGQPLLCRFDGGGNEVLAEGDVMWRNEGNRGGEFGIRFTNLDGPGAEMLMDACGMRPAGDEAPPEVKVANASPGTRVRLHIEGLGSPMKARVRDSSNGEVMVGSNLEFLRVGRHLELEDVDHKGRKRAAHIDRVDVEVDPTSRVPQLVVALRYDDVAAPASDEGDRGYADVTSGPVDRPSTMNATMNATSQESSASDDELEMARMKSKFAVAATQVGPAIGRLGARARTTLALLMAKAKERSPLSSQETQPRRTTAPPPGGALHAEGKRVVRAEAEADAGSSGADAAAVRMKRGRIAAYGGTAAGAALLLVLVARGGSSAPPGAAAAHLSAPSEGTPAANADAPAQPTAVAGAAADQAAVATAATNVQANVPLFGPTTLSTTEAVIPPPPSTTAAAPGLLAPGAAAALAMAPGAGNEGTDSSKGESADEGSDDERSTPRHERDHEREHAKVPPVIHGHVLHPNVLHVHTDGIITAMHAGRSATGFTVTLPGRRANEGASLGAKDPRIASVHVSNGAKGAELTFQFKDGIPAYALRAKGHDLQIALGRPAPDGEEPTHSTTAKKHPKEETPAHKKH